MTSKSYGLYVTFKDGTRHLCGKKMQLEDLDDLLMTYVYDKDDLVYCLMFLYPELRARKIKGVDIQYQSRGKTKKLGVVTASEKNTLNVEKMYFNAVSLMENASFLKELVEPYDDGKGYLLSSLARVIMFYSKQHPYDSETYNNFYQSKLKFVQAYLFKKNTGDLNYLHARRLAEMIRKVEPKVKTNAQMSLEGQEEVVVSFDWKLVSDQERLNRLYCGLEGKPYIPSTSEDEDVEIDDAEFSLYHDEYLTKTTREQMREQYEDLPKSLQKIYQTDANK